MERPPVHYARTDDGVDIAYQVFGDGPVDAASLPERVQAFVSVNWSFDIARRVGPAAREGWGTAGVLPLVRGVAPGHADDPAYVDWYLRFQRASCGPAVAAAMYSFLATFEGLARAVRCGLAIAEGAAALGLDLRTGIHTGEVELRGDDIAGIAVDIGARVRELAEPGEVLVTRTVKDLVAGSGLTFDDRGIHALKGVPDEWRVLAARA